MPMQLNTVVIHILPDIVHLDLSEVETSPDASISSVHISKARFMASRTTLTCNNSVILIKIVEIMPNEQ